MGTNHPQVGGFPLGLPHESLPKFQTTTRRTSPRLPLPATRPARWVPPTTLWERHDGWLSPMSGSELDLHENFGWGPLLSQFWSTPISSNPWRKCKKMHSSGFPLKHINICIWFGAFPASYDWFPEGTDIFVLCILVRCPGWTMDSWLQ